MAKVIGGIGSMLSGKIEGLVFVNYKGGTYVRSAPKRKKDSSTPRMLLNQKRFGEVIRFCGQFKDTVIPQIWNLAAVDTSGYRLFQKTNSPAFGPDGSLADPKLIRLSTGKLTLSQDLQAQRKAAKSSTIQVSWQKDIKWGGKSLKDELMVLSAADGKYSDITATGLVRDALKGSFELPQLPVSATHIYLFFASQDHTDYSESVCFEV